MESKQSDFVHLHVHTDYSILDSTIRIDGLLEKAKEFGMAAVAMTDTDNLSGAIEFYENARAAGIKPIIGCELNFAPDGRIGDKPPTAKSLNTDGNLNEETNKRYEIGRLFSTTSGESQ